MLGGTWGRCAGCGTHAAEPVPADAGCVPAAALEAAAAGPYMRLSASTSQGTPGEGAKGHAGTGWSAAVATKGVAQGVTAGVAVKSMRSCVDAMGLCLAPKGL